MRETFALDLIDSEEEDNALDAVRVAIQFMFLVALLAFVVLFVTHAHKLVYLVTTASVAVIAGITTWLVSNRQRVHVLFGTDGVIIGGANQGVTFIAYEELRDVAVTDDLISVDCDRRTALVFRGRSTLSRKGAREAERFALALNRAVAKRRTDSDDAPSLPVLPVIGETAREKVASIRTLGTSVKDSYRRSSTPRDGLWRIVESGAARLEDRIAACIALRVEASPEDLSRLQGVGRGLVGSRAADRFRIALHGDDVDVEQLFEEPIPESAPSLPERLKRRRAI